MTTEGGGKKEEGKIEIEDEDGLIHNSKGEERGREGGRREGGKEGRREGRREERGDVPERIYRRNF